VRIRERRPSRCPRTHGMRRRETCGKAHFGNPTASRRAPSAAFDKPGPGAACWRSVNMKLALGLGRGCFSLPARVQGLQHRLHEPAVQCSD
jgi:hypothetical protein